MNIFLSYHGVLGRKARLVKKELRLPVLNAAGTFINGVLCLYPGDPVTALND